MQDVFTLTTGASGRSMKALCIGLAAALAVPGCAEPQATGPARAAPREALELDEKVGWYRMPAGDTALLTYSASGGLRLFSLGDSVYWATLVAPPQGGLRWGDVEGPVIEWDHRAGRVAGFRWTAGSGERRQAERLHDYGYRVEEVSVASAGARLSGSLFLPEVTDRAAPGAVMIHGSGASDRDNAWYMMIADALVRDGIAVLLPDKRGSGKSEGDWFTTDLSGFRDDAAAQLDFLRGHAAIDSARAGLVGLSQGGHIAPMVAGHSPVAFVVNISGSAVPLAEQIVHEVEQDMKRDRIPGILDPVVRAISLRIIKRRRPEWWETNGPIDPIDHWRGVEVPALVVYGEDDELDNVPVRRSVERLRSLGRANLDVWVYAGSGHALWEPDEWRSLPAGGRQRIRGDFLRRLTEWIHDAVSGAAR